MTRSRRSGHADVAIKGCVRPIHEPPGSERFVLSAKSDAPSITKHEPLCTNPVVYLYNIRSGVEWYV